MELLTLIETAPDAIIVLGPTGNVVYWNEGAKETFGYSKEEMLGENLDVIIPEKLRDRHNEGYDQFIETGKSRYGPGHLLAVPAMTKDNRRISIEFRLSLTRDAQGNVEYVAAILRDVTKSWEKEQQYKKRIKELEAK